MNDENLENTPLETHEAQGDTSADTAEDFMTFTITNEDREKYKRLDQYLTESAEGYSRTFLKNLFLKDQICVSDDSPNPDLKIELKKMPAAGTIINILVPPMLPSTALPEDIPLEILFEDEHLVVVNKQAGLVTHPAPGNYTGTLVNAVLFHCHDIQGVGDQKRPGIVHRLDKGTSGIMVIAKTQAAHEGLVLLFSTHDIERFYEALVMRNRCQSYGTIEHPIARDPSNRLKMKAFTSRGKRAVTNYKVLDVFEKHVHMEFKLETGRTHQIRVHTADVLKMPIICDYAYGSPNEQFMKLGPDYKELINGYQYPFLHAKVLGFIHPITNARMRFEVPPPEIFQKVLAYSKLKNDALNDL
ncbi:RluA family pseudouridine synthase [Bacteriovorax sp. PP10]|uniref:Pseudouridine synthase n=1 Tax=Bacteriovorax antarcticus TaxID=3088717 RepID=A0ABU5VUZ0_9BACT|nr:RluA family pseudouridine synthase [Bacteriovorax sp. PP10]MEA9356874.1 RluA family pseudouridine synthase [Bacteriovorax sp. PP10]